MKIYDLRLNENNELVYSAGTTGEIKLDTASNPNLSYIDVDSFYLASSNGAYFQIADTAYFETNQTYIQANSSVAIESPNMNIFTPNFGVYIGMTDSQKITIDETDFIVKAPNGINYEDDYSANFTDRSLVDKAYVDSLVGTSGGGSIDLSNYIKIDGSSTQTTNNIKVGDSYGLSWGTNSNTYILGYPNDLLMITTSSAGASLPESFIQLSADSINMHAKTVSMGNGVSAINVDDYFNKVSIQSNGYFSTLDNDLLTTDRTYSFPNESGEIALQTNVRYRTTATLTATYNNGASGVGATLTATTNVVLPTQDGITTGNQNVGDRILVANQSTTLQNGVYILTSKGVAGVSPWILTRASDANTGDKLYNKIVKVELGSALGSSTFINTNTTSITVGTTGITYAMHGGYTVGTGLNLTNKVISIPNNTISRGQLSNGSALSIIGRSVNSAGAVADITATSSGQVLKRVGTTLGFHSIGVSDLPYQIISGSYTTSPISIPPLSATSFTVNIGQTLPNTTYKVLITPTGTSATQAPFYVASKTTTQFFVVFTNFVSGYVSFDWMLYT